MTNNIIEDEVHTIELTLPLTDGITNLEALERFVLKLRERGFEPHDKVAFIPASTNVRSQVTAKRSMKFDPKPELIEHVETRISY